MLAHCKDDKVKNAVITPFQAALVLIAPAIVTNVYWCKIQYKTIDEAGGCNPLRLVFPWRMSDSRNRATVTFSELNTANNPEPV